MRATSKRPRAITTTVGSFASKAPAAITSRSTSRSRLMPVFSSSSWSPFVIPWPTSFFPPAAADDIGVPSSRPLYSGLPKTALTSIPNRQHAVRRKRQRHRRQRPVGRRGSRAGGPGRPDHEQADEGDGVEAAVFEHDHSFGVLGTAEVAERLQLFDLLLRDVGLLPVSQPAFRLASQRPAADATNAS